MSLITFASDLEKGERAERFALGMLLGPQTHIAYLLHEPFAVKYKIWGAGLASEEFGGNIILNVDTTLVADGERLLAFEVPAARQAIDVAFGERASEWEDIIAVGTPPPELHLATGENVYMAMKGTCGSAARWGNGRIGFLTAGHVASSVGSQAFDQTKSVIGSVALSLVPGSSNPGADVSVVESSAAHCLPNQFANLVALSPGNTAIDLLLSNGITHGDVIAKNEWFYFPKSGGIYGDIYSTSYGITTHGDSGGAVVVAGTDGLIGHVVGGNGTFTSHIQDVQYQLKAISCIPGFGNIKIT